MIFKIIVQIIRDKYNEIKINNNIIHSVYLSLNHNKKYILNTY